MRLGVCLTATSTPTGVFNQWFETFFPGTGTLGCAVCDLVYQLLPRRAAAALPTLLHNLPPRWVLQLPPFQESSPPSCQSPPLLPVWMNVSSLSPWLSDFHAVRFSGSSGCFFVFKLLLSFFWLCEEPQCVYLRLHLCCKPLVLCIGHTFLCVLQAPVRLSKELSCEAGSFSCFRLNPLRCFHSEV